MGASIHTLPRRLRAHGVLVTTADTAGNRLERYAKHWRWWRMTLAIAGVIGLAVALDWAVFG